MKNQYIVSLQPGQLPEREFVGGKAASLLRLINNGFPVPKGFVVSTQAFKLFAHINNLSGIISKMTCDLSLGSLQKIAKRVYGAVINGTFPSEFSTVLNNELYNHRIPFYAVRSSMNIEDGSKYSFAGQFESYLSVRPTDIPAKIRLCWASAFAPRAIEYMYKHGIHPSICKPGVIVQHMLSPEWAGVTFTKNVYNGFEHEMIIEGARGDGSRVVDGLVNPIQYIFDKQSHCLRFEHTSDDIKETLYPLQLQLLVDICLKVENVCGYPLDIEWALIRNNPYILQARPLGCYFNP